MGNSFRPLSGTVFPKFWYVYYQIRPMLVSVPSRGLYFLNTIEAMKRKSQKRVSVPSRGLYFLNLYFPTEKEIRAEGFRPLSGTVFPKYRPLRPWKTLSVFFNLRGKIFFRKYSFIFNKETS